jgi:hypothetical protein
MNNKQNQNRGVDRRNGCDINQIGSNVDLTSGGDFPLALALGLAPAALAFSGIGLGIKGLIQERRNRHKMELDALWEASQTCTLVTNTLGDPQPEVVLENKPEASNTKVRTPYNNVFALPTLRPRW